jgi:hypothetical protein
VLYPLSLTAFSPPDCCYAPTLSYWLPDARLTLTFPTRLAELCFVGLLPFISTVFSARLHSLPDDGGSTDLWNVGKLIPVYTVLQPRRQPSSVWIGLPQVFVQWLVVTAVIT